MKLNINDEQGIEFLHWIFERELKPPLTKGKKDALDNYLYYNRNNECIGWLDEKSSILIIDDVERNNIKYKVCQAFDISPDTSDWHVSIYPHLKSWIEDQIGVKLNWID